MTENRSGALEAETDVKGLLRSPQSLYGQQLGAVGKKPERSLYRKYMILINCDHTDDAVLQPYRLHIYYLLKR